MTISSKKVWFITGASAGFGKAFAKYAVNQGYAVVATARSFDKLKDIKALAPDHVEIIQMDVTKPSEIANAVEKSIARFGQLDVVINNAGYGIIGAVEETSDKELRALMDTNFFGAMNVIREVLPHLRERRAGAIVNISSFGGQLSAPGYSAYSASKFALEGVSEALVGEMAPFNVKVLIVEPGSFRTEFAGVPLQTKPPMDDYQSTVGESIKATRSHDKMQIGDPFKAAAAIDQALKAEKTPLRLQLGADSVAVIKAHAENLLRDLHEWQAVGVATHFE